MTPRNGVALEAELNDLKERMRTLEKVSDDRHKQNRDDIEALRRTFQTGFEKITDSFQSAMERMADRFEISLEKTMTPIQRNQEKQEDRIGRLEIKWAYAMGYAGAGAVCGGVIFEVLKLAVDKAAHL